MLNLLLSIFIILLLLGVIVYEYYSFKRLKKKTIYHYLLDLTSGILIGISPLIINSLMQQPHHNSTTVVKDPFNTEIQQLLQFHLPLITGIKDYHEYERIMIAIDKKFPNIANIKLNIKNLLEEAMENNIDSSKIVNDMGIVENNE